MISVYVATELQNGRMGVFPQERNISVGDIFFKIYDRSEIVTLEGWPMNPKLAVIYDNEQHSYFMQNSVDLNNLWVLRFIRIMKQSTIRQYLINKYESAYIKHINCADTPVRRSDIDECHSRLSSRIFPSTCTSPGDWASTSSKLSEDRNDIIKILMSNNPTDMSGCVGNYENFLRRVRKRSLENSEFDHPKQLAESIVDSNVMLPRFFMTIVKWASTVNMEKFSEDQIALIHKILLRISDIQHNTICAPKNIDSSHSESIRYAEPELPLYSAILKISRLSFFRRCCWDISNHITITKVLGNSIILDRFAELSKLPQYTMAARISMLYCTYYLNRIEIITGKKSTEHSIHMFRMNDVSKFPRFNGDPDIHNPWTPVYKRYMKFTIPNYLSGERIPHNDIGTMDRINVMAVKNSVSNLRLTDIIAKTPSAFLTGSRIAACGFSGPIEMHQYDGNWSRYCAEYIGYSTNYIEKMVSIYSEIDEHLHIIRTDAEEEGPELEILRIFNSMCDLSEENRYGEYRPSDIDLHIQADDFERYSEIVFSIVSELRKYGTAFMIEKLKASGKITLTIVAECLNYTIDTFMVDINPSGLVCGYHTSYPRMYCDGLKVMASSHYVCARMSGAAIWYRQWCINPHNPIQIFTRCIRNDQISIILNYNEAAAFSEISSSRMIPCTFASIDLDSKVFSTIPAKQENTPKKPWSVIEPRDCTGKPINVWDDENEVLCDDLSALRQLLNTIVD